MAENDDHVALNFSFPHMPLPTVVDGFQMDPRWLLGFGAKAPEETHCITSV